LRISRVNVEQIQLRLKYDTILASAVYEGLMIIRRKEKTTLIVFTLHGI